MRSEFAKWEIKTSVFSGRKSQAGNCWQPRRCRDRDPRSRYVPEVYRVPPCARRRTGRAFPHHAWRNRPHAPLGRRGYGRRAESQLACGGRSGTGCACPDYFTIPGEWQPAPRARIRSYSHTPTIKTNETNRNQGRLGGASSGHASAFGTEVSGWQVNSLAPGSPFSPGEGAWLKPLHAAVPAEVVTFLYINNFSAYPRRLEEPPRCPFRKFLASFLNLTLIRPWRI